MKNAYNWLKKNWKWFILPLWITSIILVWLFKGGKPVYIPNSGTTDAASDQALASKDAAIKEFRDKLDYLSKKLEEKLQKASKDQIKEFFEIKDKPLSEIASWIDNLS